jgi:cell division protease FtsH
MGDLGLAAFKADEEQPFLGYELAQGRDYSEATAAQIDRQVQQLLTDRHEAAKNLLQNKRTMLDQLAAALLKSESLGQAELVQLLGDRPDHLSSAKTER